MLVSTYLVFTHAIYFHKTVDLPVTQVALRVGFGSIATFNRVFRTQKGCTPSQYRNVYLELKK